MKLNSPSTLKSSSILFEKALEMVYSRERQSFHGNSSAVFILFPEAKLAHLSLCVSIALAKAWSPYTCKDSRTCLRRCFKEDFKVLNILIANISCERSMPVFITTI